jgi:glycosyltransferase involved in cell wall biosynthesis
MVTIHRDRLPEPSLCVVVPCYNEEEMLPTFFATVVPSLDEATGGEWTILCVDDGSRDATGATIRLWHERDKRICGVSLSRNFGHQAALSVGLACARGRYIGVMDCDLQDPVEVLIQMYSACVRDELDVCYGVRVNREAPLLLRAAYSLFYRIMNRSAEHDWPPDVGDFSVISARCQRTLLALPERSRMLRGLRSWVGFRQAGISYNRPARRLGTSKYNVRKLIALALQGLISFSHVPLRLATVIGAGVGLLSLIFGAMVLLNRLVPSFTLFGYWIGASPGVATLGVFLAFTLSVLFISVGIVGEYLIVLLHEVKGRPQAIVASVIGDLRPHPAAYSVIDAADMRSPESIAVR